MALPTHLAKNIKSKLYSGLDHFWETDFLKTGIPSVDFALGGGFGYGRLAEIFGNWSSGKTMLLCQALAANQRQRSSSGKPGISILFESEGGYSADFFTKMGGNAEELIVIPTDTVEEFFDETVQLCENILKVKDDTSIAVGWDSIASTGTKHLDETGLATRDMTKAYQISQGAQLLTNKAKGARVCIIATNQTREVIGSKDSATHTPGGRGWPFAASQRVELRFDGGSKGSLIMDEDEVRKIGRWVTGEVVKNKCAAPFGRFSLPIYLFPGLEHPTYNGRKTPFGIDVEQSLFGFYLNNDVNGIRVVFKPAEGWYQLHERFGGEKFRKAAWPQVLEKCKQLRTFPYEGKIGGAGPTREETNGNESTTS
jgi:RecA/RadA recombinase